MKDGIELWLLKIKVALAAVLKLMKNWRYIILAIVIGLLFLQFLCWILNLQLLWFLMSSFKLSIGDKINLLASTFSGYLTSLPTPEAVAVIVLSLIQGTVIASIIYIARNQGRIETKAFGGSTIASVVTLVSVGCPSCGTSIIAPIVGLFVSGASAGIGESIQYFSIYLGLIVAIYALYSVGKSVANIQAKKQIEA